MVVRRLSLVLVTLFLAHGVTHAGTPQIPPPKPAVAAALPEPLAPVDAAPFDKLVTPADACLARLRHLGAVFETAGPPDGGDSCMVPNPVSLATLAPGVGVIPRATLDCPAAEALARWLRDVVVPAAERHLRARPSELHLGSSYVCRNRRAEPGKVSEHALGNAVDVLGFAFQENAPLAVREREPSDGPEGSFQRRIREGACAYFTTVLGPGTDADHVDHLHLDLRRRNRGYRICQ